MMQLQEIIMRVRNQVQAFAAGADLNQYPGCSLALNSHRRKYLQD